MAFLTLVVAVAAAIVAIRQLRTHIKQIQDESRPYVVVDFVFKSVLMQVEIKNIGRTAARDITLEVKPDFQSNLKRNADVLNEIFSAEHKISMLAPGRRILYTLGRAPDYAAKDFPPEYEVTVKYSQHRVQPEPRVPKRVKANVPKFQDVYVLDFRQWSRSTQEVDYENKNWNIAARQEKIIAKAATAIVAISESMEVAESLVGGDPLRSDVETQNGIADDVTVEHWVDRGPIAEK